MFQADESEYIRSFTNLFTWKLGMAAEIEQTFRIRWRRDTKDTCSEPWKRRCEVNKTLEEKEESKKVDDQERKTIN